MQKVIIFLVCFLSICINNANARLGETREQSRERYGDPVLLAISAPLIEGITNTEYHYNGWRIRVAFLNGIAEHISYIKLCLASNPREAILKKKDIKAILMGEIAGGKWYKIKRGAKVTNNKRFQNRFNICQEVWKNTNGAIAYSNSGFFLRIVSTKGRNHEAMEYKKKHNKANTAKF